MPADLTEHPSPQMLHHFAEGRCSEEDAAQVERHIENCPACWAVLADVSDDDFVGRLRSLAAEDDTETVNVEGVQAALASLRAAPTPGPSAQPASGGEHL